MSPTTTLSMCRSGVFSLITPQSARTGSGRGGPGDTSRRSGAEQVGELPGVDLGVVAVAVVEQHVGGLGLGRQVTDLGCPFAQLAGTALQVAAVLIAAGTW